MFVEVSRAVLIQSKYKLVCRSTDNDFNESVPQNSDPGA